MVAGWAGALLALHWRYTGATLALGPVSAQSAQNPAAVNMMGAWLLGPATQTRHLQH